MTKILVFVLLALLAPTPSLAAELPAVSPAFVGRLMRDPQWMKRLIHPSRGLVFMTYEVDSADEDFKPVIVAERLCGAQLGQKLKRLIPQVNASWKGHDTEDCQRDRVSAACTFGVANEYTTFTRLVFADDGQGGWLLEAVLFLDAGQLSDETRRDRDRWVRQAMKRLRNVGCDPAR